MSGNICIGVLALQGGFSEHKSHLRDAAKIHFSLVDAEEKIQVRECRSVEDLEFLDGLIIPGGESTSMRILLGKAKNESFYQCLKNFMLVQRKPVFGTCAGMILLANEVDGNSEEIIIGGIDITVIRNYYGSQKQSFEALVSIQTAELENEGGMETPTRMLFIRAPGVVIRNDKNMAPKKEVTILAKLNDSVVAVRQNNLIATSFHPELTTDMRWHTYFLKMVIEYKANQTHNYNL